MQCAIKTFNLLTAFRDGLGIQFSVSMQSQLREIFQITNYDRRKDALIEFSGDKIRYGEINKEFKTWYLQDFIQAANQHQSVAIKLMKDLPVSENQD